MWTTPEYELLMVLKIFKGLCYFWITDDYFARLRITLSERLYLGNLIMANIYLEPYVFWKPVLKP
jgi:hypothetical protein